MIYGLVVEYHFSGIHYDDVIAKAVGRKSIGSDLFLSTMERNLEFCFSTKEQAIEAERRVKALDFGIELTVEIVEYEVDDEREEALIDLL